MITREEHAAIRADLASLRKQTVRSRFGEIPASVEYVETLLGRSFSDDDRSLLYSLLIGECSRSQNDELYVDALRRRLRDLPNDPISHAGLAMTLATIGGKHRDEALKLANDAILIAKLENRLVRYCATNLARVALVLDDYESLNSALAELVNDGGFTRSEDSPYEFDFIDHIDTSLVDQELLARYSNLDPR
ncbi:MAG: hypothetical protein KBF58_06945 [Methyloversatilis sp.]|jgi:hypothetical protein|nr:hypothetical protein [Methyloversatilis sp.]MBP6194993.1 hypothetical protein [Methyloversatilis sp.]MBP9117797.1 hypothetical protein [Methyloversatilis sp.]